KMPTPTRIMLDASNLLRGYWWVGAAAIVLGFSIWRAYVSTAAGRMWWDGFRLKTPLLGPALLKAETARFARAMATLVGNTVPLVQSIGIAGATLRNRTITTALV